MAPPGVGVAPNVVVNSSFSFGVSDEEFAAALAQSKAVLREALRRYDPARVAVSFNGGKDAVAALHLWRETLRETPSLRQPVRAVFFRSPDEFPAVIDFVERTCKLNEIELLTFSGTFKECIGAAVDAIRAQAGRAAADGENSASSAAADRSMSDERLGACDAAAGADEVCFVTGVREDDPDGAQDGYFQPSSDWLRPVQFMRVNPIMHWNYGCTWRFLKSRNLAYCSLYDQGYTSIGTVRNTRQNELLRKPDMSFAPAFELADWGAERLGRVAAVAAAAASAAAGAAAGDGGKPLPSRLDSASDEASTAAPQV